MPNSVCKESEETGCSWVECQMTVDLLFHLKKFEQDIYRIEEKSPQQQFDTSMTISAIITLWELLTKCQTITCYLWWIAGMRCHDYPLISSASNGLGR
jgi:hypothetical protein